jgi:exonuclease III
MDIHKQLRLAFWNARGVRHKMAEALQFAKDEDLDIFGLTETKLNMNVTIRTDPDYKMERLDRISEHSGGGVAL